MATHKERIIDSIIYLANAGYEVVLGKSHIKIIEVYKSTAREKYKDEQVFGSFGREKFVDGGLMPTADYLEECIKTLGQEK